MLSRCARANRGALSEQAVRPPLPPPAAQPKKLVENTGPVLRPRRPLRVVLHGERRQLAMSQPFDAEPSLRLRSLTYHPESAGKRRRVDLELVVLRCDVHGPELGIAHRVIPAVMSETEPRRGCAGSLAEDLVPEADAEQRHAPVEKVAAQLDRVGKARGIAGSVGEDDPVRIVTKHILDARVLTNEDDLGATAAERAHLVQLDAVVEHHHA